MAARRVALVTGCSEASSLGQGLCRELLKRGYRVFATARKVDTLKDLAAEGCDTLSLDVADSESIAEAVKTVESGAGRLDILINNAGLAAVAPLLDTDPKVVQHMVQVNATSQLEMVQGFSKLLVQTANDPSLGGREALVVNVGSTAANGNPWHGAYALSKAACHSMSEHLRMEMKPLGVNVVACHLSLVKTAMTTGGKTVESRKDGDSLFYPNWDEIHAAHDEAFASFKKGAPSVEGVAKDILNQTEGKKNPPYVIWCGGGSGWSMYRSWIPQFVFDYAFSRIGRFDLVRQPGVSKVQG